MNRRSSSLAGLWFAAFLMAACSSGTTPVDAATSSGAPPGGQSAATGTGGTSVGAGTGGHGGRGAFGGATGFAGGFGAGGFAGAVTATSPTCSVEGASCSPLPCCGSLRCCSNAVTRVCLFSCGAGGTSPAGF